MQDPIRFALDVVDSVLDDDNQQTGRASDGHLPTLDSIPLHILDYPVLPSHEDPSDYYTDDPTALWKTIVRSPTHGAALNAIAETGDEDELSEQFRNAHESCHETIQPDPIRKLRKVTMRVRRLSVSSNPETSNAADASPTLGPGRDSAAFPLFVSDIDPFGLHSRRRSSGRAHSGRERGPLLLAPYTLDVEPSREDDPSVWSTRGTRSSSHAESAYQELHSHPHIGEELDTAKHSRKVVFVDIPESRRRLSAPLFGPVEQITSTSRRSSAPEPSSTRVRVYMTKPEPNSQATVASWLRDQSTEQDESDIVRTERGTFEISWENDDDEIQVEDESDGETASASSTQRSAPTARQQASPISSRELMNPALDLWTWQHPSESESGNDTSQRNQEIPTIHLFPTAPQSQFELRPEEGEEERQKDPNQEPETESQSVDKSGSVPVVGIASGKRRRRSLSWDGVTRDNFPAQQIDEEPAVQTLSVPVTPLLSRKYSNLSIDATRFREHRDSLELSRRRMMRLGLYPGLVIHQDQVTSARRRIKNRPFTAASTPGDNDSLDLTAWKH